MKKSKRSRTALLLVDFMNPLDFPEGGRLAAKALGAARRTATLRQRAGRRNIPVIYANDHFGHWNHDFRQVISVCISRGPSSRALVETLAPRAEDYFVLKPRHSAFFGTPLEFLLDELGVKRLVITGLVTEYCVLFTAHDAYIRKFALWVPADCVASASSTRKSTTLRHLQNVLRARVDASGADFERVFARRDER
jgi:nicotinamidase-related amidase